MNDSVVTRHSMECMLRTGHVSLVDRSRFWDILNAKPFYSQSAFRGVERCAASTRIRCTGPETTDVGRPKEKFTLGMAVLAVRFCRRTTLESRLESQNHITNFRSNNLFVIRPRLSSHSSVQKWLRKKCQSGSSELSDDQKFLLPMASETWTSVTLFSGKQTIHCSGCVLT